MTTKKSLRINEVMPPPIVKVMNEVSSLEVMISFGQGVPFFTPSIEILEGFWSKIKETPAIHSYSPDPGLTSTREHVARYLSKRYGMDMSPKNVIMTSGANTAFFNILATILDEKDEMLIFKPWYFNYYMAAQILGGVPIEVNTTNEFQPDVEDLKDKVTSRSKAIVLITPNNPTGAVAREDAVKAIVDVARDKNLWLISDETYHEFTYEGRKTISPYNLDPENVILLGSFSKIFGISGWRLGYIVLPDTLMEDFLKVQDTVSICAPRISQLFLEYLLENKVDLLKENMKSLEAAREKMHSLLLKSEFFTHVKTFGAYYFLAKLEHDINGTRLAMDLAREKNVVVVPGEAFGRDHVNHVRFSYGNVTPERIEAGFQRIQEFLEKRS